MTSGRAKSVEEDSAAELSHDSMFAPYREPYEHLADLLLRHDWLLKRHLARGHVRKPDDILGFAAISDEEVQRLLGETAQSEASSADLRWIERTLQQLQSRIDARVEQSRLHGVRLPFVELARRFGLTSRELDLLFACLAVELDRRYDRVYGYLHDDMSRRLASPGLAIALYCRDIREALSTRAMLGAQAPLRYCRLLEMVDDNSALPWLSRSMRVDERIVAFLVDEHTIDTRLAGCVSWLDTGAASAEDVSDVRDRDEIVERIMRLVGSARTKPLIYLRGGPQSGADALVGRAAARVGMSVLMIDAELLADSTSDFDQMLFLLFREGLLTESAVYLRGLDRALAQPLGISRYRVLMRCISELGSIVFASGDQTWCWHSPGEPVVLRIIELRDARVDEQLHAWRAMSGTEFSEADLHRLVSLRPMPVAAIRDVWRTAQSLAASGGDNAMPTLEQVEEVCRQVAGTPVSSLARRIEPRHQWADLVLPAAQLEQLTAICSQAKHASIVYGEWRFERKLSLGRGLNALFTGPPGTGKTMAAEVIAADLGVDLLKIDLSQIVSKYIGETEKNLRQLFDQAVSANAILFFDEADALLGKRASVKDAHDRYANTETAYLLQKMEEYPGITILATNLRQNMDAAFTRRMRFIVDFPFPEDEDRLRIWRSVWPTDVPLGPDVDFTLLARQFRLSGGNIRNVALAAAFLAAEEQQPVSMRHLMRATRQELQKMGRLVDDAESRHG